MRPTLTPMSNGSGSGGEIEKYNTGCFYDDDKHSPSPQIISLRLSAPRTKCTKRYRLLKQRHRNKCINGSFILTKQTFHLTVLTTVSQHRGYSKATPNVCLLVCLLRYLLSDNDSNTLDAVKNTLFDNTSENN